MKIIESKSMVDLISEKTILDRHQAKLVEALAESLDLNPMGLAILISNKVKAVWELMADG